MIRLKFLFLALTLATAQIASARTCVDLFAPSIRAIPQLLSGRGTERERLERLPDVSPLEFGSPHLHELSEFLENRVALEAVAGFSAVDLGLREKILVVDLKSLGTEFFRSNREIRTLVNPRIVSRTSLSDIDFLACLTLRCEPFFWTKSVAIEFVDVNGAPQTVRVSGEAARILEREIARLEGREFAPEKISFTRFLKHIVRKNVTSPVDSLQPAFAKRKNGAKQFSQLRYDWTDPYSLTYDVRREIERAGGNAVEKVGELHRSLNETDSAKLKTELDRWTQSEAQALLAVEAMIEAGWNRYQKAYEALIIDNLFFSDTIKARGPPTESTGLLTFSYEKEGQSTVITNWYRDPKLSDAQWLRLTADERKTRLQSLKIPERDFVSTYQVAPTGTKPPHLSGFSFEEGKTKKFLWEVSHKRYEVSLHRALTQVKSLATDLRDASSIHFHVSFDLAAHYREKDSPGFAKLMTWFKHVNDYLYLQGMEEGLHGTNLVGVAHRADDFGRGEKSWRKKLPTKPSQIWGHQTKFFSMGIRYGMYGSSLLAGGTRIGFELRDTTRRMDRLEDYASGIADATAESRWLKARANATAETPQLATTWRRSEPLLLEHFSAEEAQLLHKMNKSVAIGLMKFELGSYYDFKTGESYGVDPSTAKSLVDAREAYIQELRNLLVEVEEFRARKEEFEMQDAGTAVSMSLTAWARAAKPASLYRHY